MSKTALPSKPDDTPEASSKAKKLRTTTNGHEINYLAYEVELTAAKTIRSLLLMDGIAKTAIIVKTDNVVGILVSFDDWEQVAHFYEWSSKRVHTHQLMKTIRVQCGPINVGSIAHSQANKIIEKLVADRTITKRDLEVDFDLEQEQNDSVKDGFPSFHQILIDGVFCHHCNMTHKPILPRH